MGRVGGFYFLFKKTLRCEFMLKFNVRFATHFFGIAISLIKTIFKKNPGIFSLHSEFKVVGTPVGPNYELSAVCLDP